jgi:hypothetical protein
MVHSHIWNCTHESVNIWDCACTEIIVPQYRGVTQGVCTCDDNYACLACVTWMSKTTRKHYDYVVRCLDCNVYLGAKGYCTCED